MTAATLSLTPPIPAAQVAYLSLAEPGASVIIVNYNGRPHLERCLTSLRESQAEGYEIILVDNASTDDSIAYVAQAFPEVHIVPSPVNGGFGQGNNAGVRQTQSRYLLFLNPDTEVTSGWATALIAALEDNPQVGLVTSKVLLMQRPEQINTCGNAVHTTGLTLCRGMGMSRRHYSRRETVNAISGAAFAMRQELFEALGGFDETFFLYMEDTDLSLRARLAGYQCLYVPDSVVYHDYQLTFGPQKTFYQERNRYVMLLKTLKWPTLAMLFPTLLLAEGVTWGFALLNDRAHLGNKLQAYGWIIEHWRSIMERRRQVQALRRVRDRDLLREHVCKLDFEQAHRGVLARLAGIFFNPLFWALHRLTLTLVWW